MSRVMHVLEECKVWLFCAPRILTKTKIFIFVTRNSQSVMTRVAIDKCLPLLSQMIHDAPCVTLGYHVV